jgi:uncharacterized protein YciI
VKKTALPVGILAFAALGFAAAGALAQEKAPDTGPGGYEMTTYYVGFLYKGPKWTAESTPETQKLQEGHLANILRMSKEGKLLVAGPFLDNGDLRGLYVFKVGSMEEARAFADTDPAIQAGRLRLELHPWYAAKNITVSPTAAKPAGNEH